MKKTLLMMAMFIGFSAMAAQNAKVIVDSANVYDKPQTDGAVVGTVTKDSKIAVSNQPTNGFYKTRTLSGALGWISGNDISTAAVADESSGNSGASSDSKKPKKETPTVSDHSRIQIFGGINYIANEPLASQMLPTGSVMGFSGGAEIQFKINELFYWGGRAEYLTASSETKSGAITQTVSFSTIPLMLGGMIVPLSKPKFRLGFGAYVGISLLTSLKVEKTSAAENPAYSSSDLCEYANVQASYKISNSMAILGEAGYRLHSATGGYPQTSQGTYAAFKPSFGGLAARLGVEFRL